MRRNIDLQSVRPAGLEPAEPTEQRRKSPLGAQGTALCSGRLYFALHSRHSRAHYLAF